MIRITRRDIDKLMSIWGLTKEQINKKLLLIQSMAYAKWANLAQHGLHTSKRDYLNSLNYGDFKYAKSASIVLLGKLANMVENGARAFNLRDTLLRPTTKSIRTSKAGYLYLSVPFRHKVKDIGKPYEKAKFNTEIVRRIKVDINRDRKDLSASTTQLKGLKTAWGGRLKTNNIPLLRARHVSDIYKGMVKMQKFYRFATQASYMTWRVISQDPKTERFDEGGVNWSHPGIKAHRYSDETQKYIEGKMDEVMFSD